LSTETPQKLSQSQLDDLCINSIRFLAIDAVEKATCGHPGAPMGLASIAYVLWTRHLRFNPKNPNWINRDRFILSNGHASMLLYSLLYLSGYEVSLDDLKNFRQWGSNTPGHPEYGMTPGVETTTGPLGQGFGNGVGFGIAEQFLRATYNRPNHEVINHHTYVFAGDGCMEEGLSHEAASLAGHLQLGNLIYFYDDNGISIEGRVTNAFSDNTAQRFEAYGWHIQTVADANDLDSIDQAIQVAKAETTRPSLIICKTHIGYGSPNMQDARKDNPHGKALGKEEVRLTKENLGWPQEPTFYVPAEALTEWRKCVERGAQYEADWNKQWEAYKQAEPTTYAALQGVLNRELVPGWDKDLPVYKPSDGPIATRRISGKILQAMAPYVPTLIGGSADLDESTNTGLPKFGDFEPTEWGGSYTGRTMHYGVREHAMCAAINGMALHGGLWPYGASFLTFTDYARNSIRLAALMQSHSIFVFTHDSIGLGEDGPTHQPIEHVASLRAIPGLSVIRPADANETVEAWRYIMQMQGPAMLILSRQALPVLDQEKYASAKGLAKGGYILSEAQGGTPQLILIATGSEVQWAIKAQPLLEANGIPTRVVSMPSTEIFDLQSDEYREQVLPEAVTARLSIEMGVGMGWSEYVGGGGASLSIEHFGASAPLDQLLSHYGFTTEKVVELGQLVVKDVKAARAEIKKLQKTGGHGNPQAEQGKNV
jgi:transketolase